MIRCKAKLALLVLLGACGDDSPGGGPGSDGGGEGESEAEAEAEAEGEGEAEAEAEAEAEGEGEPAVTYVTYLGDDAYEQTRDVAVNADGSFVVAGGTGSTSFPTTTGAHDETQNGSVDIFVSKFAPDGALLWSTFLGGSNYDRAYAVETDPAGNVYVGGRAGDNFPTTAGVPQPNFGGDDDPNGLYGSQDGVVAKFDPDGVLLWATYFGSTGPDVLRDIAVDGDGDVYLGNTGTLQTDFPLISAGAYQTIHAGATDALIAKLDSDDASVIFCTYFGGSDDDGGTASIRVHSDGTAYYHNATQSTDLPVSGDAYQATFGGGTFDLYVVRLTDDGSDVVFATYFGGDSGNLFSETHGMALDTSGNAYLTLSTTDATLTTTAGAYQASYGGSGGGSSGMGTNYPGDGYVARLSSDGTALLAATYLGGSVGEGIEGAAVDGLGNLCLGGATFSTNFPATVDAFQPSLGGDADAFVAVLAPDLGSLVYASYLGGDTTDHARSATCSPGGVLYVVGETQSTDFPVTAGALDMTFGGGAFPDAFVAQIVP